MYKDVFKKITALLLCACMAGTSVDLTGFKVLAAEEQTEDLQQEEIQTVEEEPQQEEIQAVEQEPLQEEIQEAEEEPQILEELPVEEEKDQAADMTQQSVLDAESYETELVLPQEAAFLTTLSLPRAGDPIDLADPSNTVKITYDNSFDHIFSGTPKRPTVSLVTCNGTRLNTPEDYVVTYGENTKAGTDAGSIIVTGTGANYMGSATVTFDIEKFNMQNIAVMNGNMAISTIPNQAYSGSEIRPGDGYKLRISTYELQSSDYTITYTAVNGSDTNDITNVGQKRMTITAADDGNCYGKKELTYAVSKMQLPTSPQNISGFTFTGYEQSYVFNGSAITPKPVITYNGKTLQEGEDKDYTLTYRNNTSVGNNCRIVVTGVNNFSGTCEIPFSIAGKDIGDCTISWKNPSEVHIYNKREQKPEVTVVDDGTELREGTHFSVKYSDNTNAGTATATVSGIGSYAGTDTLRFTIQPYNIETDKTRDITIAPVRDQTYTGEQIKPTPSVTDNGTTLVPGKDFEYGYKVNENVTDGGTVIIYALDNNYTGKLETTFNIIPRKLSDAKVTVEDWREPGNLPQPNVVVTYKGEVLRSPMDYNVNFYEDRDGKNPVTTSSSEKTGYAIITAGDNANYEGTLKESFQICGDMSKAVVTLERDSYVYTGKEIHPVPETIYSVNGNRVYAVNYEIEYLGESTNVGEKKMVIKGVNAFAGEQTVTYKIEAKPMDDPDVVCEIVNDPVYTGDDLQPEVSVSLRNGTKLEEGRDFTFDQISDQDYVNVNNNKTVRINLKARDNGNFVGSKEISFHIKPRPIGNASFVRASDIDIEGIDSVPYAYTGTAIQPDFTVSRYGVELKETDDYSYRVDDYLKAGTATITVTGRGNYTGSFKEHFEIKYPLNETKWAVGAAVDASGNVPEGFTYEGGSQIRPNLKITFTDVLQSISETLKTTDYSVLSYSNNINVSGESEEQWAQVTIEGQGKFMGQMTIRFKILPKDIASNDIEFYPYAIVDPYNGATRRPTGNLNALYKLPLVREQDYEIIAYADNGDFEDEPGDDQGSHCVNSGTVTMTVEGRNNYKGTRELSFDIPKKDLGDPARIRVTEAKGWTIEGMGTTYNGQSQRLTEKDITLRYVTGIDSVGELTLNSDPDKQERVDYKIIAAEDSGDGNFPLEEGQNLKDSPCVNAGVVQITVGAAEKDGKGNYTGERVITYNIWAKSLINTSGTGFAADIRPEITGNGQVTYNREVQNPTIKLTDTSILDEEGNGTVLEEGRDYTVTYMKKDIFGTYQDVSECKDAGEYLIRIEGINNYQRYFDMRYEILPRDLNEKGDMGEDYRFAIRPIDPQTYTGDEIIPESLKVFEYTYNAEDPADTSKETAVLVPVDNPSDPYSKGDYRVEGTNNINATPEGGTNLDWAILTITGSGNYTGTLTTRFVILPKNIADKNENGEYDVRMTHIYEETYCGLEIDPGELPLQYNGHDLVKGEGKDYTVSYTLDEEGEEGVEAKPTDHTNVGPVYGTITGNGNYTGTRVFNTEEDPIFRIVPRSIKDAYANKDVSYTIDGDKDLVYDGLPHEPVVELTDTLNGEKIGLIEGKDYTVTYDNSIAAGNRTITITGINNYGESFDIKYQIAPKPIVEDNQFISGSAIRNILDQIYTGDPLTQDPVITDTILRKDENGNIRNEVVTLGKLEEDGTGDYEVICNNNVNATSEGNPAQVTIRFTGNYTGTYQTTFNIAPRNIAYAEISVEPIQDQEYSQVENKINPRIVYGTNEAGEDRVLQNTVDYTLEYTGDCTNVGTVTVTINGTGNFFGTRVTSYRIVPKDLETGMGIQVAAIDPQIYKGEDVVPEVVVTDGAKELEAGLDYVTSPGENAMGPGMAGVVITGINNYSGSRSEEFRILVDLENSPLEIVNIPQQAYTGSGLEPTTTIRVNGTTLVEGVDYNIIGWENNVKAGVDTAGILIQGNGDGCIGKKTIPFTIAYMLSKNENSTQPGDLTLIAGVANEYTYTSNAVSPKPSVSFEGRQLQEGTDYVLSYSKNIEQGTATLTITGAGMYMGTVTRNFRIVKKNLANCTYSSIKAYSYDGKAKTPVLTVKDNNKTLVSGKDYTLAYKNNTEAGVGQVVVTGKGNYTGTVIRYFSIILEQPKSLKMSSNTNSSIKLSWTAGGKVTGYEVYRMNSNGKYQRIATTKSTSYTNKKLGASKTYQYRIRAYYKGSKGNVYSGLTGAVKMNTKPGKPTVTLSSAKKGQVKISWKKLNSAGGYEVYQSTSKKGKYSKIATINKGSTKSYTKTKLTSKKTYYYKVRAYKNINGNKVYGEYSSVKSKKVK